MVTLCLPPLSEDDPLLQGKKSLLSARNFRNKFQLSVHSSRADVHKLLDEIVQTTRILYLDEVELYFVGDDDIGPFSPRNELESLNSILLITNSLVSSSGTDGLEVIHMLQNAIVAMIKSVGSQYTEKMVVEKFEAEAEKLLLQWGESHGAKTKLKIAYFEGAGRGAVASEEINIGDSALEIPDSLIISEDLVRESDMFDELKKLDGMTGETMLLLWSMRERYNTNSKFKIYFDTLPERFNTGLSFGVNALTALDGTLLFEELFQAREHLRQQYDALCPALCTNHPHMFQPEIYTWDQFLWACELWYSNGMKIVFADGKLRTCLVPIAGLLNHSLCPHILHYGRVDPTTKSLKFFVSRPCEAGEQCYLSYGNFSGSHLVSFYGFLPKGINPYDIIPLDFDVPRAGDGSTQSQSSEGGQTTHMVREILLPKGNESPTYGLPPRLLARIHDLMKGDEIELQLENSERDEDERATLETISSIFNHMMEGFGEPDEFDREESSWDVKLALDYKETQRRIVSSVLASCSDGLRTRWQFFSPLE